MYHHRAQTDSDFDAVSLYTGLDFDPEDDKTRQEYRDESDIHFLLNKFGGIDDPRRPLQFGEADFDVDLLQAHEVIRSARERYNSLPQHIRDKYPDMLSVIAAHESGDLPDFDSPKQPPTKTEGVSPEGSGGEPAAA